MDQLIILILFLIVIGVLVCGIVMPIVALVISLRSKRQVADYMRRVTDIEFSLDTEVRMLRERIDQLERVLGKPSVPSDEVVDERQTNQKKAETPFEVSSPLVLSPTQAAPEIPEIQQQVASSGMAGATGAIPRIRTDQLESVIGRRWLGWVAVAIILFATAFFLKYAFDNRWIGELGRVAIGVFFGMALSVLGFRYHQRQWRIFSQILTAGGIVILYVSVYAAFGYYHLVPQRASFAFLIILIAEAAGLALLYNAPAIAIMALVGGFLTPLLLHSERDQYRSFFGYIVALDVGALGLLRHWPGLSSLAFFGSHLLFWIWYSERYHPRKLLAVLVFQGAVFLIFLLAHLGRRVFRRPGSTVEELVLLVMNPFVFFGTAYHLLNVDHHDWMGVFAIGMALVYSGAAKVLLDQQLTSRSELLTLLGIALTFVTIAIPIQLRSNWITIAWAVEALIMLWAGLITRAQRLRVIAITLFALTVGKLIFWDTPLTYRTIFTPILNRYFLSSFAVIVCMFAAAALYKKEGLRRQISAPRLRVAIVLVAVAALWFVASVETQTFFAAKAAEQRASEDASHQLWLGQMALSVVWAVYAALLAAVGFVRRSPALRWASLALFGLTIVKAMLVDIAALEQLYRIIVFFVLGLLLLLVAWGYHKAFYSKEAST